VAVAARPATRTGSDGTEKAEISALLVPAGTPGFSAEKAYDKLGWHASDTHPLSFEDVHLPEDSLLGDKPITLSVEPLDPGATTRRLLSRLVGQMDMWQNVIAGRDYDMSIEAHEPIADMRRRLDVAGPAFLAEVRRVVEGGRLDETFIDAYGPKPEVFTYGGLIAHVLTFAAHRRLIRLGSPVIEFLL
jgi:hypothetical protein